MFAQTQITMHGQILLTATGPVHDPRGQPVEAVPQATTVDRPTAEDCRCRTRLDSNLTHRLLSRRPRDQRERRIGVARPHVDIVLGDGQKAKKALVPSGLGCAADFIPCDLVDAHSLAPLILRHRSGWRLEFFETGFDKRKFLLDRCDLVLRIDARHGLQLGKHLATMCQQVDQSASVPHLDVASDDQFHGL